MLFNDTQTLSPMLFSCIFPELLLLLKFCLSIKNLSNILQESFISMCNYPSIKTIIGIYIKSAHSSHFSSFCTEL